MVDQNGSKYVPLRWVISILVALFFSASGLIVADTRSSITRAQSAVDCLQREKVDKEQHYRELSEIRGSLLRIEDKIDKIRK